MDWAQVLVIILAVFLSIFLLLAIALVVMLIRISRQIKSITTSAQNTAITIERIVMGVKRAASPLYILQLFKRIIRRKKG